MAESCFMGIDGNVVRVAASYPEISRVLDAALSRGCPLVDLLVDWSALGDGQAVVSTVGVHYIAFVRPDDAQRD